MGLLDRLTSRTGVDEQATGRYDEVLKRVAAGSASRGEVERLDELAAATGLSRGRVAKRNRAAFDRMVARVLDDEVLTVDEEREFLGFAKAMGIAQADFDGPLQHVMRRLILARANDGRLPVLEDSQLVAKRAEVVHIEIDASLTKEVVRRERRGGYGGISVPVGLGVRVNTGGVRGRTVVVGTEIQVADTGVLSMTSKRAVFVGARKTLEFRYDKLAGVQVYTDAIGIGVTNRQAVSTLRVVDGPWTTAMLNAIIDHTG